MKKIQVVAYNPKWKLEFEKAKTEFEKLLCDVETEILHVGSTSIEGLWAKPILDIDIVVGNERDSKRAIELLESVGYRHVGNLGVEGREAFKYEEDNNWIQWMEHHLYVCLSGCGNLRNHLLLQKHLRKHKEAVEAYSQLKRKLAERYPDDMDFYIDGKTELITGFLKAEGMDSEELERIEAINKKEEA